MSPAPVFDYARLEMTLLGRKIAYGAAIFDCDGTLALTAPVHYRALHAALKLSGFELPRDWYYQRLGVSRDELLWQYQTEFRCVVNVPSIALESVQKFQDEIKEVQPIQRVADMAREISRFAPVSVASGGQRSLVAATLRAVGLASIFEHVVTIEDVSKGKPSPELFLLAALRMVVDPYVCIVFEDSDEGIQAASLAGMTPVDVRSFLPKA